ncbi:MAG: SDR family NAD(P)-dependent oxidoreductase [Sarcina sp.]
MNKYVFITGASSGIGKSFSYIFAKQGFNLILLGRNEKRLETIKSDIENKFKIEVVIYAVDLNEEENIDFIWGEIDKQYNIDIFINNAGLGFNGKFLDIPFENHAKVMDVNIMALTKLTYLVAKQMKKNNGGKILNVASTGSFQAGPMIGVYYASKAYVLSFSVALREELKEENIDVCTLCPGATKTEFSKRAGKGDLNVAMSSDDVALIGYKGLMKGKAIIVPGTMNKIAVLFSKVFPYIWSARAVKKIQTKAIKNND